MGQRNNKGFTLVELIVVIVILAILIGVTIGGIYKYVSQSRENTDINNASSLQSTLSTICANENVYKWSQKATSDVVIKWKNAIKVKYSEVAGDYFWRQDTADDIFDDEEIFDAWFISDAVVELLDGNLPASKTGKGFTFTLKHNDGNPTVEVKVGT